jgi:putative addiction module component (TIGR02574 family)
MTITPEQIEQEALRLSPASRAQLADKLVESLDGTELDDVQRDWISAAVRRRDEIRSGAVKPVPGDEVLAEARRRVGR